MVEKIKMLTLRALVSDRDLMHGLVLKGGNALQLAYQMTDRASLDIDFSIEGDFSKEEYERINMIMNGLLVTEFEKEGLVPIDVKIYEKPKNHQVKEWKGYVLEFKVLSQDNYSKEPIEKARRLAIPIYPNNSTKFQVEISSYEYTKDKKLIEVEGTVFHVYTPEMIVFEKIRALCQSLPNYKEIIPTASVKGRSRDLYDIYGLMQRFEIDIKSEKNKTAFKEIFAAKRVPLKFVGLLSLEDNINIQRLDWDKTVQTITGEPESFEFYYEHMIKVASYLITEG